MHDYMGSMRVGTVAQSLWDRFDMAGLIAVQCNSGWGALRAGVNKGGGGLENRLKGPPSPEL